MHVILFSKYRLETIEGLTNFWMLTSTYCSFPLQGSSWRRERRLQGPRRPSQLSRRWLIRCLKSICTVNFFLKICEVKAVWFTSYCFRAQHVWLLEWTQSARVSLLLGGGQQAMTQVIWFRPTTCCVVLLVSTTGTEQNGYGLHSTSATPPSPNKLGCLQGW